MKSPAFQFYPRDWISSSKVTVMDLKQRGAYIQLLCYDWLDDGIPDNDIKLSALSGVGEDWDKGGYSLVKACFIPHPNRSGYLTNERLLEEREKQRMWHDKSSDGGKKSAKKRWGKTTNTHNKGGYKMVTKCLSPNCNSSSSSSSANNIYSGLRFKKPTIEELTKYSKSIDFINFDPEAFLAYYDSNGWKVGKNQMKSWEAAVVTWKKRNKKDLQPTDSGLTQEQKNKQLENILK